MYIMVLLNYILGYVTITVEGYFIERFINICNSKRILLWGIKRKKSSIITTKIGIKDFKRIKDVAKTTKCKIQINEKKGLPFILHKYRKRKIFLIMIILISFSIFVTSNYIWNIEIIGLSRISDEEIINTLKENGIDLGTKKKDINTKEIINNIRLQRNDIAWIGIDITGTNLKVEIVETDEKPEIIDEEICNIVATKDGIITKIIAENGTAQVKEGDVIKKGDILIGGWIEGKYTGTRYVHSKGTVEARVWYSKKEKKYFKATEEVETGTLENKYKININNFEINLYKSIPKFEKYDTINENKKFKIFSNFYLPIQIEKTTYIEKQEQEKNYGTEECREILIQKIEEELLKEIENEENILNKQINENVTDDYIEIEMIYEVIEEIGTNEKMI